MLGSGAIVVMDETTDMVKACWRIVRFFARESCGKCTPCREGTTWLERILRRILDGYGRPSDLDLLLDVADNISPGLTWPPRQTTICLLGPSAVVADRVGAPALPRRVRALHRARAPVDGVEYHEAGPCLTPRRQAPPARPRSSITVDGRAHEARPGELVIAACEDAGTYIPRFCYHRADGARSACAGMCLVEVDTGRVGRRSSCRA